MTDKSKTVTEPEKTTEQITNKTSNKATAKEAAKVLPQEKIMYVGPTVPGIGIQNCVYTEIPASAKDVIRQYPEIGNLFVRIKDYPKINKMLREGQGYICSAFNKAIEIKINNAENANKVTDIETE